MLGSLYQAKHWVVTYSGCLGDRYTGFGTQIYRPKNTFQVFFFQSYFNKKYVEAAITDLRTDCVRECNFKLFGGTNFENFPAWSAPAMVAPS